MALSEFEVFITILPLAIFRLILAFAIFRWDHLVEAGSLSRRIDDLVQTMRESNHACGQQKVEP